nr:type II toxin-antitoxin system VapB family antitoxin [Cellulomonas fimi]
MIFKAVGDGRPYPDHGLVTSKQWADVPPRQVRLDELVTTKRTLNLDSLLSDDSTFYGDLFAHVVQYKGVMYLEDGLHRAVRAALQQRPVLHARVLVLPTTAGDEAGKQPLVDAEDSAAEPDVQPS